MKRFVEIAVNVPRIQGTFHYHVPPGLEKTLQAGQLVMVPFGERVVQGIVLRDVSAPEVEDTKPVSAVVDQQAIITRGQIALAEHLSEKTLAPTASCIGVMLPPGLTRQADTEYQLEGGAPSFTAFQGLKRRLVQLLEQRGKLRGRQIEHTLPKLKWKPAARKLDEAGVLSRRPVLPLPRVRPKTVRTARLVVDLGKALEIIQSAGSSWRTTYERRENVLHALAREAVAVDVSWIYAETGANLADLKKLAELDLLVLSDEPAWRDPLAGIAYDPSIPPELTSDQAKAWNIIKEKIHSPDKPILLHGVTGSGKTEIYLQAVDEALRMGKQAVVLVPEIALTPQTIRRFLGRFPGKVGLMHSRLSAGERYDTWRRARQGQLQIIVGPRSALFAPLPDLGLIVVDECHETSYAQTDRPPLFHAADLAAEYARMIGALCLLGSATPRIETRYAAEKNRLIYLSLPSRILAHQESIKQYSVSQQNLSYQHLGGVVLTKELPPIEVVDMRQELMAGNRSPLSRSLQNSLQQVLDAGQQAILFLNRRGTATYVFCRDCGYTLVCPRCETPLTWHEQNEKLTCHHCGYQKNMPPDCPVCESANIRQLGLGTQRLESVVQEAFPKARLLRWDSETTRSKGAHEIILSHFSNHRADILIGTQMLAKGLDLPLVTLVGAVLADVGLNLPDFRAGERAFQVLTQVAGRAGRSPLGGKVIFQTFNPDSAIIQAASAHDYEGFFKQELQARRLIGYPPFSRMVRLLYEHHNSIKAADEAERMGQQISSLLLEKQRTATAMIGPAPCFYQRLDGKFRWQIILRGPDPASVLHNFNTGDWRIEVDPQNLL